MLALHIEVAEKIFKEGLLQTSTFYKHQAETH